MRNDQRKVNQLRKVTIETDYVKHPEGSVLISFGDTKVICNASIEDRVPPFLRNQGKGWITAEYAMLPRATENRNIRESSKGKVSGRTMEIQRLIGRALRAVVDLDKIGERTLWVDCDVIQADGGTRTASITGAFVAVVLALGKLVNNKSIKELPISDYLTAISVGVLPEGEEVLDLCYEEDSKAQVDMNVVMTGNGEFVELQGTGEEATFSMPQLQTMLSLAQEGVTELVELQREAIGEWAEVISAKQAAQTGGSIVKEVLIATKNAGKVGEFQELFAAYDIAVKSLLDFDEEITDIEETGTTFSENAAIKAEAAMDHYQIPVIADDSGLEIDALDGAPGVYSARYAGKDKDDDKNMEKVLDELIDTPLEKRTARFVCAIAIARPNEDTFVKTGVCEGSIALMSRGANGFGYDPIFIPKGSDRTMAEHTSEEKNSISHRHYAILQIEEWLKDQS